MNLAATAQNDIVKKELLPQKKEQYIQRANQYRKEENYSAAIIQLDSILAINPIDAGILLYKGDLKLQSKLFSEAVTTYKQLLPLNFEPTITRINLSYALFMNHHPAKALKFAKMAWEKDTANTNAIVNYFNAMLWNIKTKEAGNFLQAQRRFLSATELLVLKARLYTTSGNYNSGLIFYDSLVTNNPNKYFVQEYAEVLLGKKELKKSEAVIKKYDSLFSINEYKSFQQKLKASQLQNAGTEFVYFKDVAKNTRIENIVWWQQREGRTYRFGLRAGNSTITSEIKEKTNAQFAQVTINERWNKTWSGQSELLIQRIQPSGLNGFTALTGKQSIQYQPNDRRMVGIYYSSDILNFTASLLQKNIRSNNLGYVTHIMLSGKTGIYSQGSWGALNDENKRMQFFGSFYHLFRTEPTLKAGLNFSALHFSNNTIKNYFAPNRYLNTEIFTDYSTALPNLSKFYLMLQAAAGLQKIETQNWDPAFRFQSELGMRLEHFETGIKYQTSNVASANGTGYKFNWFTLRLMWKW